MIRAHVFLLLASVSNALFASSFQGLPEHERATQLKHMHNTVPNFQERVVAISEVFLGTPYKIGPLGEGENGEFDRDPLINFDAVDCTTFIEQVLALARDSDLKAALGTLQKIRYRQGIISYENRNHFVEVDWIANNIAAGYLRDITEDIDRESTNTITKYISKHEWYSQKSAADITGFPPEDQSKKLPRFQQLGDAMPDERAEIKYLPMSEISRWLPKIPSGSIANLIRANMHDKPTLVSHQIFIIDKNGEKIVRHAAQGRSVEDVPALEYFSRYANSKWPLLGLNILSPQSP